MRVEREEVGDKAQQSVEESKPKTRLLILLSAFAGYDWHGRERPDRREHDVLFSAGVV